MVLHSPQHPFSRLSGTENIYVVNMILMEIETPKTYQPPAMDVLELELEQNVLNDVSGDYYTEELKETTFEW